MKQYLLLLILLFSTYAYAAVDDGIGTEHVGSNLITTSHISIQADNKRLYLGTNNEASIYFDDTDSQLFFSDGTTNNKSLADLASGAAGGDAWSDSVDSDILPTGADNTYDLGSAAASFADVWIDGTGTLGTFVSTSGTFTIGGSTVDFADNQTDNHVLTFDSASSSWRGETSQGDAETNSLETTITGIADTEIFIGNGVDSGTFAVLSGDATLANTGTITLEANSVDSDQYVDGSIDNIHVATGIDAVKIADGSVTNAEFQYINSLSSNAQTQISVKAPTASPTFTGTVTAPILTVSTSFYVDDDIPLYFGDDQDASIYYDSTTSKLYFDDNNTVPKSLENLAAGSAEADTLATVTGRGATTDTEISLGTDDTTKGSLIIYGDNAAAGGIMKFYNAANEDTTEEYFNIEINENNFNMGYVSDIDQFKFSNAGNFTATGNIGGNTYASDGSVTDAELKYINTLSSNAQTQIDGKESTIGFTPAPNTVDYLVGTASGSLSAEIVAGTSPGGELGGTWASPTIDDGITVTGWTLGTSEATVLSVSTSFYSDDDVETYYGNDQDVSIYFDSTENDLIMKSSSYSFQFHGDGNSAVIFGSDVISDPSIYHDSSGFWFCDPYPVCKEFADI